MSIHRPRPRLFYGWIVAAAAFICVFISSGIWYTFQVFFVAFLDEFHSSRAETSLAFSICVIVYSTTSALVGWLNDRFGPRWVVSLGGIFLALACIACSQAQTLLHLYITWGLLIAFGISLVDVMPAYVVLCNWFVRYRGTAMGMAASGAGVGLLVFLPFTEYLVSEHGWRFAFIVIGVITAAIITPTAAFLYRRSPQEMGLLPDGERQPAPAPEPRPALAGQVTRQASWTAGTAGRTLVFWLLLVSFGCAPLGSSTILTHQVAFMKDAGLTATLAASIAGLVGIGGAAGRLLLPALSDRISRLAAYGLGAALLIAGVVVLFLGGRTGQVSLFYLYALLLGIGYGPPGPIIAAVTADIFHGRSFGAIYGLVRIGSGIGGAAGPWLAGYVFDTTGSYDYALAMAIMATMAGFACLVAVQAQRPKLGAPGG